MYVWIQSNFYVCRYIYFSIYSFMYNVHRCKCISVHFMYGFVKYIHSVCQVTVLTKWKIHIFYFAIKNVFHFIGLWILDQVNKSQIWGLLGLTIFKNNKQLIEFFVVSKQTTSQAVNMYLFMYSCFKCFRLLFNIMRIRYIIQTYVGAFIICTYLCMYVNTSEHFTMTLSYLRGVRTTCIHTYMYIQTGWNCFHIIMTSKGSIDTYSVSKRFCYSINFNLRMCNNFCIQNKVYVV